MGDGHLWFGGMATPLLGRLDTGGEGVEEHRIPAASVGIREVAGDPDGRIWFIQRGRPGIGVYDAATGITSHYAPPDAVPVPSPIAIDDAGRVWVADERTNRLARLDPKKGSYRIYRLPFGATVSDLVVDRSGRAWFTDPGRDRIGVVGDSGS
jgi:streptogramin lyase